jgi:hypothetical protein
LSYQEGKKKRYAQKREFESGNFQNWNWGVKMGEYTSKRGKRQKGGDLETWFKLYHLTLPLKGL